MPDATQELFRNAISEGGDTGMLIAADGLDESAEYNPGNATLAELLRKYVEVQTMVRMSMTPPLAFAKRFQELQAEFNTKPEKSIPNYFGAKYTKPLGPYYLALSAPQNSLAENLNWLSVEPVRELTVTHLRPIDPDLALILRNYRMESMFRLHLSIAYGRPTQAAFDGLCAAVKGLNAPMLQQLTLSNVGDRRNHLQLFFNMAGGIPKGCELWTADNYREPARICIKKR